MIITAIMMDRVDGEIKSWGVQVTGTSKKVKQLLQEEF